MTLSALLKNFRVYSAFITVLSVVATLSGVAALAQTGTGSIRGQALDAQSRAVPGVRITISDQSNKLARTQVTDGSGEFFFVGLPPATYRLDAEAAGFRKLVIENVTSTVNITTEVPARLEVGEVTQSVTVTSDRNRCKRQTRLWATTSKPGASKPYP
jgi:hypothetical protein